MAFPVSLSTRCGGETAVDTHDPRLSYEDACRFARSFASPSAPPEGVASGGVPDSSHGVHSKIPLRRKKCCASTPGGPKPSIGPKLPRSGHVPPLSFHPTPTVYSAQHLAGLLHPATGHGVRHVSDVARRSSEEGWRGPPSSMTLTLRSVSLPDCRLRVAAGPGPRAVGAGFHSPSPGIASNTWFQFVFSGPSTSGH